MLLSHKLFYCYIFLYYIWVTWAPSCLVRLMWLHPIYGGGGGLKDLNDQESTSINFIRLFYSFGLLPPILTDFKASFCLILIQCWIAVRSLSIHGGIVSEEVASITWGPTLLKKKKKGDCPWHPCSYRGAWVGLALIYLTIFSLYLSTNKKLMRTF